MAYIDASLEKENGNKDNFTEMIPMYTVGNKKSRELGKANYDKAIEKCEKAIKLHRRGSFHILVYVSPICHPASHLWQSKSVAC